MIKVLFVCLGNICRSPMAEALLRHKVKEAGLEDLIQIDSAGTGNWHAGEPPHEGTRRILDQYQISHQSLKARQLKAADFAAFDVIIAMDDSNVRNMKQIAGPDNAVRIHKLLDFLPERGITDVPDPYFTGNFEEVYEMVDRSCDRLLAWLLEQKEKAVSKE
jgi:protein-tyrosine phosphatase